MYLHLFSMLFLATLSTISAQETSTKNIEVLYVNGAKGHLKSKNNYANNGLLIVDKDQVKSFVFSDMDSGKYAKHLMQLGQGEDIERLSKQIDDVPEDKKVVLFGLCRGGAAILNALPGKKNIAAVVAESTYARADDAVTMRWFSWLIPAFIKDRIFSWIYPAFNKNGEHPIDAVPNIDKNIPIALVCIKYDMLVPYQSTKKIYDALIKSGHNKVHLLVLEGWQWHARITDNLQYKIFIHAFNKKYGLPRNPILAQLGDGLLDSKK